MNKLWRTAFSLFGFGAVGAFILWSLYKQWLVLPIFSKLSSNQTFILMIIFLFLTFFAFIIIIIIYTKKKILRYSKDKASDCYNAGLFTILVVVFNKNIQGYENFRKQSIDSWKRLGIDERTLTNIIFEKQFPEEAKNALTEKFPIIIEKSFGEKGRSFYELGLWTGIVFAGVKGSQIKNMGEWLKNWKYKCAEVGNPEILVNFIKKCEEKLDKGEIIDPVEISKISEDINLWIIANGKVKKIQNIMDIMQNIE